MYCSLFFVMGRLKATPLGLAFNPYVWYKNHIEVLASKLWEQTIRTSNAWILSSSYMAQSALEFCIYDMVCCNVKDVFVYLLGGGVVITLSLLFIIMFWNIWFKHCIMVKINTSALLRTLPTWLPRICNARIRLWGFTDRWVWAQVIEAANRCNSLCSSFHKGGQKLYWGQYMWALQWWLQGIEPCRKEGPRRDDRFFKDHLL